MINEKIIKSKLIANCPIFIQGMGTIHSPSLKEIIEFSEDNYFKLLILLTSELSDLESIENLPPNYTYFDYIMSVCYYNESKRNEIISILTCIFKEEITFLVENMCFFVGKYTKDIPANKVNIIDRDNFCILQKIIRIQNGFKEKKKIKKEKEIVNPKIEKLRKLRDKGRKEFEKAQGSDKFSLENMISTLGVYYLDINKVLLLNLYQANNQYEKLIRKEKYFNEYKAYISGADPKKLNLDKHWSMAYVSPKFDEREVAPENLKI